MNETITTDGTTQASGRIGVRIYDSNDISTSDGENLSRDKRSVLLMRPDLIPEHVATNYDGDLVQTTVDPIDTRQITNVTTERFHEYLVDNIDPNSTASESNIDVNWFAVGTDGSSGTNSVNTDLNNRVYSDTLQTYTNDGDEFVVTGFLDQSEANGNGLDEIGLFTGNPTNLGNTDVFMVNHASFSEIQKDVSIEITFELTLTFSDT